MANISLSQSILEALAAQLQVGIPELKDVHQDFPSASQELQFPCASLFTGAPTFRPEGTPYALNAPSPDDDLAGDPDILVKYVVGHHEYTIQMDLWCSSKEQRDVLFEKVQALFSSQFPVMGLTLTLTRYHNEPCHYTVIGHNHEDTEESSQRREWRLRVSLLADARAIQEYAQSAILESETQLETSTTTLQ